MRLDDLSSDGQPQSRSSRLGGEEGMKDALADLLGNPRPGILDDNPQVLAVWRLDAYAHEAARGRRLEGVVDQIAEHLGEPEGIAPHGRDGVEVPTLHQAPRIAGANRPHLDQRLRQGPRLPHLRLGMREGKEVLHEAILPIYADEHPIDILAPGIARGQISLEQLE